MWFLISKPQARSNRFQALWEIRFRGSSSTIPSTKNIGAREIFREPRRVTSFVTRHRRRGGRLNTENYGSKTRYALQSHKVAPMSSSQTIRPKFMPIPPPHPCKEPGCTRDHEAEDIEKSDLFKHRFTRGSKKADNRVTIIGRGRSI